MTKVLQREIFGEKVKGHDELVAEARNCTLCAQYLPHTPNPIFSTAKFAKVLIIGQAPGLKAHESGIAFNDASGDRLRSWLSVSKPTFTTLNSFLFCLWDFVSRDTKTVRMLPERVRAYLASGFSVTNKARTHGLCWPLRAAILFARI